MQKLRFGGDDLKISEFKNGVMSYREMTQEEVAEYEKAMQEQEETERNRPQTIEEQILELQSVLISQKISGGITITDSSTLPIKDFAMQGKTEQASTTGAQLFDVDAFLNLDLEDVMTFGKGRQTILTLEPNTKYTMSTDAIGNVNSSTPEKDRSLYFTTIDDTTLNGMNTAVINGTPRTVISDDKGQVKVILLDRDNSIPIVKKEKYVMLNQGETPLPYEQYTGGKPSPSVEYPQEIVSAGKYDEVSGKYVIDVGVTGKNLIDVDELRNENGYLKSRFTSSTKIKPFHIEKDKKYLLFGVGRGCDYSSVYFGDSSLKYGGNNYDWLHTGTGFKIFDSDKEKYIALTAKRSATITNVIIHGSKEVIDCYTVKKFGLFELMDGETSVQYEPYHEPQTLQLQLEKPLTKWDRIEKRDGVYGIVYKHRTVDDLATLVKDNTIIYDSSEERYFLIDLKDVNFNYDYSKVYSEVGLYKKDINVLYVPKVQKNSFLVYVSDTDTIETAKEHLHYKVICETDSEEFVPLPEETQIALNLLHTNYPTTIISNSEDCEMEVEYIADTKNYIDKKFVELSASIVATQKALL